MKELEEWETVAELGEGCREWGGQALVTNE